MEDLEARSCIATYVRVLHGKTNDTTLSMKELGVEHKCPSGGKYKITFIVEPEGGFSRNVSCSVHGNESDVRKTLTQKPE
jgi:hypothetical protein